MEVRLLAHACGDTKLIDFFNNESGDFFRFLASHWLGKPISEIDDIERGKVKGICYGW